MKILGEIWHERALSKEDSRFYKYMSFTSQKGDNDLTKKWNIHSFVNALFSETASQVNDVAHVFFWLCLIFFMLCFLSKIYSF